LGDRQTISLGFSDSLLSLRGFAAVVVLLYHCFICFKVFGVQSYPDDILKLFLNGEAVVTFFFVHSGFVLALSLARQSTISAFYIKRFFRLEPLLVVAAFLSTASLFFLPAFSAMSLSTSFMAHIAVPIAILQKNLLKTWSAVFIEGFYPSFLSPNINVVFWTMRLEGLGSLFFPLFLWMYKKLPKFYIVMPLLYGLCLVLFPHYRGYAAYLFCFMVGIIISGIQPVIEKLSRLPLTRHLFVDGVIFTAMVGLLTIRRFVPSFLIGNFLEAFFSAVIIYSVYYCRSGWFQKVLEHHWSKFIGEISFSLYALHIFVIRLIVSFLSHQVNSGVLIKYGLVFNFLTAILCLVITIPLSYLTFRWVEQPFMGWGKIFANRMLALKWPFPILVGRVYDA